MCDIAFMSKMYPVELYIKKLDHVRVLMNGIDVMCYCFAHLNYL